MTGVKWQTALFLVGLIAAAQGQQCTESGSVNLYSPLQVCLRVATSLTEVWSTDNTSSCTAATAATTPATTNYCVSRKLIPFYPQLDEVTALDMPKPSEIADSSINTDMWVQVLAGGKSSEWKQVKSGGTMPFFRTIIAKVSSGKIDSLTWDETCKSCQSGTSEPSPRGSCIDGACFEEGEYPVRVYVGWIGTDSRGYACTSGGHVFSRFRTYDATGVYDAFNV